jgi:hypothetical protein
MTTYYKVINTRFPALLGLTPMTHQAEAVPCPR